MSKITNDGLTRYGPACFIAAVCGNSVHQRLTYACVFVINRVETLTLYLFCIAQTSQKVRTAKYRGSAVGNNELTCYATVLG